MEWISPGAFPSLPDALQAELSHRSSADRLHEALIGIEFSELETNLLPLFLSELGQFPQNLGFAHYLNLTGAARCCQDENWFVLLH